MLAIAMLLVAAGGTATSLLASAAPATPRQVQLTGTQLAAALVPASAFAPGYQYDGSTDSSSGSHLETGPAKYKPSSISCPAFAVYFGSTGWGETAVAGARYGKRADDGSATSQYGEGVYQFASDKGASAFWHGLRELTARCPGLGSASPTWSVRQQISAIQLPGAQAFELDVTAAGKLAGLRMTMHTKMWIAVAGQDVFEVDATGIDMPVPAVPTVMTITHKLITRVQTAR